MTKSRPNPPSPPNTTRVDRFLHWAKTNRVVATLIIVGIVVGAVGAFTESAKKLVASIEDVVRARRPAVIAEPASRAKVRRAATVVGAYYTRALGEGQLDDRPPSPDEWRDIEAALRDMQIAFLADQQPGKAKVAELALEQASKLRRSSLPWYWKLPELASQRDEFAGLFAALGVPMPGADASIVAPAERQP